MKTGQDTLSVRIRKFILFLIEPKEVASLQQKHQSRLLSAIILIILLLGSLSGIVQLWLVPNFLPTFLLMAWAMIIFGVAYFLARMTYYLSAAVLACITPILASVIVLLSNPRDESAFVFMLIGVLLSSILLNKWQTVAIAALDILVLSILPLIQPAWSYSDVAGRISFHVILSVLVILSMSYRDVVERDRQKEIIESELKFRSIFDHSADAIGVSRDGIHIMVNPAYLRMFGYASADQLVGQPILNLIAPSERTQIIEKVRRRSARLDVPSSYETRGLRSDGTEFDMEVRVSSYELGGALYTVPILRDITNRKRIEDELRASERRYRAIVESTTDLICRFLPDTTLTFVNEAYCRYFGQPREQLIGVPFLALVPKEDWAAIQAHTENVIHSKTQVTYSHQVITPGGELRWQQWTDSTILNEDGNVVELQSVGRDITEQVLAENTLKESERRLREMLERISMAGLILDRDGGITFINDFLLTLTGWSRAEVLGKDWFDTFLPPEIGPAIRTIFAPLIAQNQIPPHYENEIITRQGQKRLIRWNNTILFDSNENVIGTASIGEDVTERRQIEDKLRLSEERYRILAQNLPGSALLLFDQDLRIILADGPELASSNFPRSQMEGKLLREALPDKYAQLIETNMRRALAGEKFDADLPIASQHYRSSYIPLRDEAGRVFMAMILAVNITQLKHTEDALRDSQRRLSTAMRATQIGVWEWDMRTNKAYWSDENYLVLGLQPGSIESTYEHWSRCLHPEDLPAAEAKVAEAVNSISDLNIEFRVIWPDGSIHWINDIGRMLVDDAGQPLGMYGVQMDITERKRAEAEREKLIAELKYRNIEAESLRESAATVALSLDLEETSLLILDQLQRVVSFDSATVQLLLGNILEVVSCRGFTEDNSPLGMHFVLDEEDPAYPIIRDGVPYILHSNIQAANLRFEHTPTNRIHSWLAIPLHARGRLVGLLTMDGFAPAQFTNAHVHFASTFANQVAVTFENSRLYTELQLELAERQKVEQELRRREGILDAVAALAGLLLKSRDWRTIIDTILERLGRTIDASHAYLFETHPGPNGNLSLSIRHEWAAPAFKSDLDNPIYQNVPLLVTGMEKWYELVVEQGQPYVGDVTTSSQTEMEILNVRGIKAIVDVPIRIDDQWWGVIGFDDRSTDRIWMNVEVDAMKVAANVLGAAIQRQLFDAALKEELLQRGRLIEELELKNSELERFTYTVSHDLKSPLVTISGFLGYLQEDARTGNLERLERDSGRISEAVHKMQRLLNELLELSRIGRLMNPPQTVPFEEVAHEAIQLVYGRLEAGRVITWVEPGLPKVHGDRQRLVEFLQNLVDNAAKFMGDQPEPRIEIGQRGRENGKVIFYVRDNGIGIDAEYQERIFGLFDKLDAKSEGTGIGLALVKRIVEVHGGRCWVESRGRGYGTTVNFTLPAPPVEHTPDKENE